VTVVRRNTAQKKLRILHVIPNVERGGAERVLVSLCQGLVKQGYDVHVLVLGRDNEFAREFGSDIPVLLLGYPLTYRKILATVRCLLRIRKVLLDIRPTIIHSHLWPAARMVGWARSNLRLPHIVHIHAPIGWLEQKDLRAMLLRYLTRNTLSRPGTFYIATGRSVAEYTKRCLRWLPEDIAVVYNGFDHDIFSEFREFRPRSQKDELTFGLACRLVPGKGIDRCLRAFKMASFSRPWKCLIAGYGSERSQLEKLAYSLGLNENVVFLGPLSDMVNFYKQLDVFVQPSLSEGLSLATIEAMACSVPVVATDVGATRELVREGIDGLLVPPDDVRALSVALSNIAKDDELRRNLAAAAHERAWSQFSSVHMLERVIAFYNAVIPFGSHG